MNTARTLTVLAPDPTPDAPCHLLSPHVVPSLAVPDFAKCFDLDYFFEETQTLKFAV